MECGALSKFNKARDVGIVHGVHQAPDLQKHLKKYVRDFILCPQCNLPELQQKVDTKRSLLMAKCASCGWRGGIKSTHKVKTYMINNPGVFSKRPKSAGDKG